MSDLKIDLCSDCKRDLIRWLGKAKMVVQNDE